MSETIRNLSAWIWNLLDPKRSTPEKVRINRQFFRNLEPEIIFMSQNGKSSGWIRNLSGKNVKSGMSPEQSEICPQLRIGNYFHQSQNGKSSSWIRNLSETIRNLSDPKRSSPEKVRINPKFLRNLEPEIIFVKVKMENRPGESGICPKESEICPIQKGHLRKKSESTRNFSAT